MRDGMGEIGAATDEMNNAVRALDTISQENRVSIERVSQEISKFKTREDGPAAERSA